MTETEEGNFTYNDSKKKSYRRRSSISQRRLYSYGSDLTGTEHDDINTQEEEPELRKYINDLKKENLEWKRLFEKLKKENNDYKERSCGMMDQTEQLALLSADDKQFLQERPEFVRVGRLLDQTKEAVALRQRRAVATCNKLHNLIQDCSHSVTDLTEQVIWQNTYQLTEFHLQSQQLLDHLDDKSLTLEPVPSAVEQFLTF